MKKFIALYYAPSSAMARMANTSEEDKAKGMEQWFAWKEKCGEHILDFGAPLMPAHTINAAGKWGQSTNEVTGYSILQGESEEQVKGLLEGHPHLSWFEGCSIEVHGYASM